MNPLTIEELRKFRTQLTLGEVKATEIRPMWERLWASEQALTAEFSAMKKDELVRYVGPRYSRETKGRMVEEAISGVRMWFVVGALEVGICYKMGEDTLTSAIERQLDKWTDEVIQKEAAEYKAEVAAKQKAITTPETLSEFERFIEHHGRRKLTPEQIKKADAYVAAKDIAGLRSYFKEIGLSKLTLDQRARYEALQAAQTKGQRVTETIHRKTTDEISLPEGVTFKLVETKHTQKGHDLWVVQLSDRVARELFDELNWRAKKIGGYYSAFARNGAVPGFQFDDPGKAQRFMSMERVTGELRVQELKEERQERNEQRLTQVGETLQERGEDKLNQDRKENTARRASMAAAAEADARHTIQIGETAVNLADAVGSGAAKFLDRLYNAEQVAMLARLLKDGQRERIKAGIRAGAIADSYSAQETESHKQLGEADAGFARYPWPVVHTSMLLNLITQAETTAGAKLVAGRVRKMIARESNPSLPEMVTLSGEYDRDQVRELALKIRRVRGRMSYAESVLDRFEDCVRLNRMDIKTEPELRTALREYVQYRAELQKPDPLKQARREFVGTQIPSFFPTPSSLAAEVVVKAAIGPGMCVLEPNAGMADLVDAIDSSVPDVKVDLVELNTRLIDFLEKKGHTLVHKGDFLDYNPGAIYDRIVMNPPFENGQDIIHVEHAYKLLKPGGKLVAIMSEGAFFHTDRRSEAFRGWLEASGGESKKNGPGAFAGDDAFRQTGAQTRIVTVERNDQRQAIDIPVTAGDGSEHTAESVAV